MANVNEIIEKIEEKGYKALINKTVKNGVELTGITIGDGEVRPTVYIDEYINEGLSTDIIVEKFIDIYEKFKSEKMSLFNVNEILSWDYAKDNVRLCIQKKGTEDIIKRDFLDLEIYIKVNVNYGSYKVNSKILQKFGVSEDEIFERAAVLTRETVKIETIVATINKMAKEQGKNMEVEEDDIPQLILTNEEGMFGAVAIYYTEILKRIAKGYNSSLVILPSSIHECIIQPDNSPDMETLSDMVKEINEEYVNPEEVLSDHAYFFNRETGKIEW